MMKVVARAVEVKTHPVDQMMMVKLVLTLDSQETMLKIYFSALAET